MFRRGIDEVKEFFYAWYLAIRDLLGYGETEEDHEDPDSWGKPK